MADGAAPPLEVRTGDEAVAGHLLDWVARRLEYDLGEMPDSAYWPVPRVEAATRTPSGTRRPPLPPPETEKPKSVRAGKGRARRAGHPRKQKRRRDRKALPPCKFRWSRKADLNRRPTDYESHGRTGEYEGIRRYLAVPQ